MINETVETINTRLGDRYGIAWNGMPILRVVWSNDQLEKRRTKFSDAGIELPYVEVREVPKYGYIPDKYILEQLVAVDPGTTDLIEKISYEPLWTFADKAGFPLPPKWEVCVFVMDLVEGAKGKSNMVKYVEPDINSEEGQRENMKKIHEGLFGDETKVSDALGLGTGVTVPSNFEKSN